MEQLSLSSDYLHSDTYGCSTFHSQHQTDYLVIDRQQQFKYRTCYTPDHLDHAKIPANDYFAKLATLRLKLVRDRYDRGRVLDLCCGSGDYLLPVARFAEEVIGVDFSPELVTVAQLRAVDGKGMNVSWCVGNARNIPLKSQSIALVFSFSSLYHVPRVDQVVKECARVLEPGGVAILEFGLLYSLNTLVCKAYPELATPYHVPLRTIHKMLAYAGLTVEEDRALQLLPLWGDRPRWLGPFLFPFWKRLLAHDVGGRMLDEFVSGLWPLRTFAFRHIIVSRKLS